MLPNLAEISWGSRALVSTRFYPCSRRGELATDRKSGARGEAYELHNGKWSTAGGIQRIGRCSGRKCKGIGPWMTHLLKRYRWESFKMVIARVALAVATCVRVHLRLSRHKESRRGVQN